MSPQYQPEGHLPPPSEGWQTHFEAQVEGLVDMVFSHEAVTAIEDLIQGTPREVELYDRLRRWKGWTDRRLAETVEQVLADLMADLAQFRAGAAAPAPLQISEPGHIHQAQLPFDVTGPVDRHEVRPKRIAGDQDPENG